MINEIIEVSKNIVQKRNTTTVALKVAEETGELAQAINKNLGYDEVVSEVADVIISAIDVGWNAYLENQRESDMTIAWDPYENFHSYEEELKSIIHDKLCKWVDKYGE